MLERCLINFFSGRQMVLMIMLFLGLASCSTLNPAEKKAAFSPPDINLGAATGEKTAPPPVVRDGLAMEKEVPPAMVPPGGNSVENAMISGSEVILGIKLLGLRLASAGYMLDFRYTVLKPQYAHPMFDRSTIPYLIHEKSGARFAVPNPAKVGPLRATTEKSEAGRRYYIFFANPGRYVKEGDLVTVVVGKFRFEHLEVQ